MAAVETVPEAGYIVPFDPILMPLLAFFAYPPRAARSRAPGESLSWLALRTVSHEPVATGSVSTKDIA